MKRFAILATHVARLTRAGLAGAALVLGAASPAIAGGAPGEGTMEERASQESVSETRVAAPGEPARLVLDAGLRARAGEGPFSLALTPTQLSDGEAFLVSVVAETAAGARREIASLSFFPPPREGEPRRFPLDLSRLPAGEGPITLEIGLVPVEGALEATRVRVEPLGARAP